MNQHTMRIEVTIQATVERKAKWYLASCPDLDVHAQGDTEDKAKASLIDAISLFLSTCLEMGTFSQVLKESGFHPEIVHDPTGQPVKKRNPKNLPGVYATEIS